MSLRTYLPLLRAIAKRFCDYVGRNRDVMIRFLTEEQLALVDGACAAVDLVIEMLDGLIAPPT